MSYIGSSAAPLPVAFSGPQSEGFDGGTATFTLSRSVTKVTDIEVVINNVPQSPYDGSYSVSGSTLTTSETVSAGTKNVIVKYRDVSLGSLTPLNGSIGKTKLDVASLDGTGAAQMPSGSTAQRPSAPTAGMRRFNTTLNVEEYFNGTIWVQVTASPYLLEYLIVAGGAGGGSSGGGGGAGGLQAANMLVAPLSSYDIVVGAGGAIGNNGGNSSFSSVVSIGGGKGGANGSAGSAGGSGGGGSYNATTPGSGTTGQGFAGGSGAYGNGGNTYGAGGGGGAGAVGGNSSGSNGGVGGVGVSSSISGTPTYYAGGGGGIGYSANTPVPGAGGTGGGGTGSTSGGTTNTGGGGGTGNAGGSGIVIVRYLGSQKATGGTVTSSGGYTIHTFTSSGTFTA